MSTHSPPLNERLSALMDGELPAAELDALLEDLAQQDSGASDWHLFHMAGDVLRSEALAPHPADLGFLGRFEQKLAQEAAVYPRVDVAGRAVAATLSPSTQAANGPWRWVARASFVLVVGAVSVGLWSRTEPDLDSRVAAVPAVMLAPQGQAVMLRDPELDALMAAHQQMGGHSAWQMPSGFLRNATYERPLR